MPEQPGIDANSAIEMVEASDDLPGKILSIIYVGKVNFDYL